MITLERVRLVNWHYFEDIIIEIGNRCLLAGDNGSGKSTIIDAIQYVIAANLRMARFNSAAEERRGGGRDLMGYVRCKLGSESTEYRRGDTIAHIMLQWRHVGDTGISKDFINGVCIEAYKDNHYSEHFWISSAGSSVSLEEMKVCNEKGDPLQFRQFKNIFPEKNIYDHPTKKDYTITWDDIINRGRFDDTVGIFPVYADGLDIKEIPFTEAYFQVPFRILTPQKVENILAAGRCISCEPKAVPTTRQMDFCMVSGQAAGAASSLSIKSNVNSRDVDIRALQKELERQGLRVF